MEYDIVADIFNKLALLAAKRQQPLIIIENPKKPYVRESAHVEPYILTIGNASVLFNGFAKSEMIEVYAEIRAQLYAEEAAKHAHEAGWRSAKEAYAKST
jgi:hypothetical protein